MWGDCCNYKLLFGGLNLLCGLNITVTVSIFVVVVVVVMVVLDFTTLLTSQVISVAFYSEREKSGKFCSEALISAWGSFTCRKSTTQDSRFYLPSEGSHTQDFYALNNPSTPTAFEPMNLGSSGECDNHGTTGLDIHFRNYWYTKRLRCSKPLFHPLCKGVVRIWTHTVYALKNYNNFVSTSLLLYEDYANKRQRLDKK